MTDKLKPSDDAVEAAVKTFHNRVYGGELVAVSPEAMDAMRAALEAALTASTDETKALRDVAVELAFAAGELVIALDGQEKYRAQRQAVLNAMKDLSQAFKDTRHEA